MTASDLYLDLLKRTLLNLIYRCPGVEFGDPAPFDLERRLNGYDWPRDAHTMVGMLRLDHLQRCCQTVLGEQVPGDFMECGVWRGGASILMRGVLAAHGDESRRVFLADSFHGLPPPDADAFPQDAGDTLFTKDALRVSQAQVREHFDRYGLLDERVRFIEGWFKDTLPTAPVERIAVLRLDGDMYESTWQALEALYPKVTPGGFVVIDDYGAIPACKAAVHDFRAARGITAPMETIDWTGVAWRAPG